MFSGEFGWPLWNGHSAPKGITTQVENHLSRWSSPICLGDIEIKTLDKENMVCIHCAILEKKQPKKQWNLNIGDMMDEASEHLLSKITPG